MEEPYDDSKPYPPEWEEHSETISGHRDHEVGHVGDLPIGILAPILGLMGKDEVIALNKVCEDQIRDAFIKQNCLACYAGLAICSITTNEKGADREGFHGMIHVHFGQNHLHNAKLNKQDAQKLFLSYAGLIQSYFQSISDRQP